MAASASMPQLPPPPFKQRFGSSSSLVETHSPLAHEVVEEAEWPEETSAEESGHTSPSASRRSSGQQRHAPKWHTVKTSEEVYLSVLEQRLAEVKSQRPSVASSRRNSSPSHLSHLAFQEDVEETRDPFSGDEDHDEEDSGEDSDSAESERRLLPSPPVPRRLSTDPAPQPVAVSGRIAFAPVVRIAAGIRSLAGSYTPYSGAPSRSTSPASSIYAPLLPTSGMAPGAALKQAAKYGTVTPPAQVLGRQAAAVDGSTVASSSPYKSLAKEQRQRKKSRRRKRQWIKFKRKVGASLRYVFCCGCLGQEDE